MAKLSKINKYAILWLKSNNISDSDIAKELKLSIKQISSVVLNKNTDATPVALSEDKPKAKGSKDFMIRETANRVNSVAIMTKEASSLNDEFKKNNKPNNNKNQNSIYRIS